MASSMDAICSFIVSVWRQALGTVTRIMEGSQLCTFDGGKAARRKTVHTSYYRIGLVGILI